MEKEVNGTKPLAILQEKRWTFHGLPKNAVFMLLEVGCTEDQVGAIVGMPPAMVQHYAKEVSKFRLARSAMKLLRGPGFEPRALTNKIKDLSPTIVVSLELIFSFKHTLSTHEASHGYDCACGLEHAADCLCWRLDE
jgi:hypothetical protein